MGTKPVTTPAKPVAAKKEESSSSDDSDSDEEDEPTKKPAAKPTSTPAKPVAAKKEESSSSDDSDSDEEEEPTKKAAATPSNPKASKPEDSSSSEDSDSDEGEKTVPAVKKSSPAKKEESSSSSDDSSEDEKSAETQKKAETGKRKAEEVGGGPAKRARSEASLAKPNSDSGIDDSDTSQQQLSQSFAVQKTPAGQRIKNEPFRRVKSEDVVIKRKELRDNSYQDFDTWGNKANQDLIVTKGKSFRAEKTKKKRGSYRGGAINVGVNSIKFGSDDE